MATIATHEPESSYRRLLTGLLAAPISWALFFLIGYFLSEVACRESLFLQPLLGLATLTWIILAIGLLALAITAYVGIRAYREWSRLRDDNFVTEDADEFLAFGSVVLSAIFFLAILGTMLAPLLLEPCEWI